MFILNITFPTFILWSVQAVHTSSLARPSVLTQQQVWLFDLYLCSSSPTYHCLFNDWCACSCLDGISFVCLSVQQPNSSVMFVSEPICPLSVEYNESIIKGSPSQNSCMKIYLYKPK